MANDKTTGVDTRDDNDQRNSSSKQQQLKNQYDRGATKRPETTPRRKLSYSPPRASRTGRSNNASGRRYYNGKQAENLGDSSIESIEEGDEVERWSDDGVSALSGIGNDSIEDRKKKRANRNRGDTRGVRYYSNSVCMKCFLSFLQGSFS